MAKGQLTFLQLVNRTLSRLGKPQTTGTLSTAAADSWPGLVRDAVLETVQTFYMAHDWSTLITSGTFLTSLRTYDLATSFSGFGREIDLADTDNNKVLIAVNSRRDLDELDPGQDNSGTPTYYHINYPDLTFDTVPSAVNYRLRYVTRPATLSANGDVCDLPEFCDRSIILWTVYDLLSTREDDLDMADRMEARAQAALKAAIIQDKRRVDAPIILRPLFQEYGHNPVPFPKSYGAARWM